MGARVRLFVLCFVVFAFFSFVVAQESTPTVSEDSEEQRRELLYDFAEAITAGDFALIAENSSPDYIIHSPMGDLDAAAFGQLIGALQAALTDFEFVREEVLVDGNRAARSTFRGVFENDFVTANGTFPPTGQPFELGVISIYRFTDDGLFAEEWAQFDNIAFLTQLGMMPTTSE